MGMEIVEGIMVVMIEMIFGYCIVEVKGIVRGGIVKVIYIGRDIMVVLRNIKGGEVREYI